MKLRPLEDKVVLKQMNAEEKTTGKVLDSGKEVKVSVKKNDKVIYAKYAGSEIELEGKKYVILRESDILGVVEK